MNSIIEKALNCAKQLPVIGDMIEKRPKVTVLRFAGIIADGAVRKSGISHHKYAKLIDKAFEKGPPQAVALVINSPGGAPAQTSLIASQIRRLAEDKEIPVYAFVEDVAASGGYWLACAADEIYAQECSIVGSVGVIYAGFGFEDFIAKHDIRRRVHTAGTDKSFMDPFVAEKPGDVKRLSAAQKHIHTAFKDWVKDRRGEALKGTDKTLFEGQFWTAGPALEKGLIDGVGDVRAFMRDKFGDTVRLIDLTPEVKIPLLGRLTGLGRHNSGSGLSEELLDTLEGRALWGRFGL